VLTADIGSHADTFLELAADDDDDESAVDVVVDIGGNVDSVVIGLVCLDQCRRHPRIRPRIFIYLGIECVVRMASRQMACLFI
jgi:hypothetical protein